MSPSLAPVATSPASTPADPVPPATLAELLERARTLLIATGLTQTAANLCEPQRAAGVLLHFREFPPFDVAEAAAHAAVIAYDAAVTQGAEVQVSQTWAGGRTPHRSWLPGYRFVALDGAGHVMVTPERGLLAGIPLRFSASDVRVGGKPWETDARGLS